MDNVLTGIMERVAAGEDVEGSGFERAFPALERTLGTVWGEVAELFRSNEAAARWLLSPIHDFAPRGPLKVLIDEGNVGRDWVVGHLNNRGGLICPIELDEGM